MISVILPVYNVADYLPYAMESLLNQTYQDFEILLIDDGSTDQSPLLCDQYAASHDHVYVYHKENGGLSDARNYGVSKAKGEWISFVDPDDYLEPCALELLVRLQEQSQAQMVSAKTQATNHHQAYRNLQIDQSLLDRAKIFDKEEALTEMLYGDLTTNAAMAKLMPKAFLEKYPYPKGRIYEDLYVISQHVLEAGSVCIIDAGIYHYYLRPGSITGSAFTAKQYDFFVALEHLKEVVARDYQAGPDLQAAIDTRLYLGCLRLFSMLRDQDKAEFRRIRQELSPYLSSVLRNKRVKTKLKVLFWLMVKCPTLYFYYKKLQKS